jgi:putative SOS response-associated peptidase YedK
MCGRYFLITPGDELKGQFGFVEQPNLAPRYNIAPTQEAPVLRQRREPAGERTLQNLRWGLVPPWATDLKIGAQMINARAETALDKPAFRNAFRRRRCLVPADGFYEWRQEGKEKRPYLIARRDGAPFAFAGLWERWTPKEPTPGAPAFVDSFTILTTTANALLRSLHERMPVILPREAHARWLDPDAAPEGLRGVLVPAPEDLLRYVPVGSRVNAAHEDDAALIAPTGPEVCSAGA